MEPEGSLPHSQVPELSTYATWFTIKQHFISYREKILVSFLSYGKRP